MTLKKDILMKFQTIDKVPYFSTHTDTAISKLWLVELDEEAYQ
jgi:hypothetical protein